MDQSINRRTRSKFKNDIETKVSFFRLPISVTFYHCIFSYRNNSPYHVTIFCTSHRWGHLFIRLSLVVVRYYFTLFDVSRTKNSAKLPIQKQKLLNVVEYIRLAAQLPYFETCQRPFLLAKTSKIVSGLYK